MSNGNIIGVKASDVSLTEGILRLAAVHQVPVRFQYAKSNKDPIETRTFIPGAVQKVKDHVTFTGYDEDRGQVRAFRDDRIKGQVQFA